MTAPQETPRKPAGRPTHLTVSLTTEERRILHAWQRSLTLQAGRARRGRIILLLDAGLPISRIAETVGISRRFVYKWVARFLAQGLDGLKDQPRGFCGQRAQPAPRTHGPLVETTCPSVPLRRRTRHVATTQDVERIWTLRKGGFTWPQIAQTLGLSLQAISQARRRGVLAQTEDT